MSSERSRTVTCICGCGRTGPHHGRGLITACWHREKYHGRLNDWPLTQAPVNRPMRLISESVRGRLEDYLELRSWGVPVPEAARRLGVSERTITRYNSHLRAQEESRAA
ncbi:hypothetical protein ACOQFV_27440 [Nocardiopsis changdeensis]|uniref:Uncharacterized protein n=1 Tax=Nocardiopsis changdeensis TaxID=2831969 RepID=A0ABX8BRK2_9ACTN|nr:MULTISPECIES: hypothetical protein [Nocardiopsis]QUX23003.1 hypothetical protein KGD84_00900 [Nocardiopsis changdeensis]QYX38946.1 hypothetical protein K1J57_10350 [Nocardiopsis sp. MT53]